MAENYKTLSIPEALYFEVENFIKRHPELGYVGVTEFFKEALRDKLRQYETKDSAYSGPRRLKSTD